MRLIDADYLKNIPFERQIHTDFGDTAISIEEIDNTPTVTIKEWVKEMPIYIKDAMLDTLRPHGNWIKIDGVYSKCSRCDFKYADYRILFDYCPNCGADMRGCTNG